MESIKLRIPLINFDLENSKNLNLENSNILPISEFPEAMRKDLRDTFYLENTPPKYFIEIKKIKDEEPRRTLDRILTLFKLYKDFLVLSKIVYIGEDKKDYLPHYTHWIDEDRGLPIYLINENEELDFIDFWKDFFEIDILNFAVNRFHIADFRPYSKDRFVDYVESLEFLLVPDSVEGEISFRFRNRGCLLLGKNLNIIKKKEIYEALKNAYSFRSAIVHGVDYEKYLKNRSWESHIKQVRMFLRELIKIFHKNGLISENKKRKKYFEDKLIFCAEISL